MNRLSKLMTPKKEKDNSEDGASSPVSPIEEVEGEENDTPEVAQAKRYFRQICKVTNTDSLNKHDFKMLITKLIIETGNQVSPSEQDIEEAFVLADEDKGGTVDIDEFIHLFELILADKINGIHLGEMIDEKVIAKSDRRRTIFLNALTDKREEKKMRDVLNKDANSMPEGEYIQYAQRHLRQQTSSALSVAKTDWEGRNKHTVALQLGNYGKTTESAKNREVKKTLNNTPASEMAEYNKTHGRKEAQNTLAIAKNDWELRVKETTPQDIGNLGTLTVSAQHRSDAATFDNTSSAEITQYNEIHGRALTSATLTSAREEWEARDKHTQVDDIGHLGALTKVAQNRLDAHGEITADNTGAGEMEKFNEIHGREIASLELTKAKEEWEARDKHTIVDDIGHLGQMTVSAQTRMDNRGITNAENTPDMEFQLFMQQHDRELISEDLTRSHNEWLIRHNKHQQEVLELFKQIDTDNSGGLDIEEVIAASDLLKITKDEAIDLFNEFEIDDNGCISLESFRAKYSFKTISKAFLASRGAQPSLRQPSQFMTEAEKSMKDALGGRDILSANLTQHNSEWKKREESFSSTLQARTEAFKKEAVDYFNQIDVNHSGHIMIEDFRTAVPLLQLSQDEIDTLFYDLDIDGNGDIDIDEFYAKYSEFKKRVNVHQKKFVSKTEEELKSSIEYREIMSQQLANAKNEWTIRQKEKNKTLKQRIELRKKEDAKMLELEKLKKIKEEEDKKNSSSEMFAKLQLKQEENNKIKLENERLQALKIKQQEEELAKRMEEDLKKIEEEKRIEEEAIREAAKPRWRKIFSRNPNHHNQNNNQNTTTDETANQGRKWGGFLFRGRNQNNQQDEQGGGEENQANDEEYKEKTPEEETNNNINNLMNEAVKNKKNKIKENEKKQSQPETSMEKKARIMEQRRKIEAIKEARLLKAQKQQEEANKNDQQQFGSPLSVAGDTYKGKGSPL